LNFAASVIVGSAAAPHNKPSAAKAAPPLEINLMSFPSLRN
jgi:hypothetical protein